MIEELFVDFTILITFLFIGSLLNGISFNKKSSYKVKTILGLYGGFVGIILMYFGIHIDSTLIDLRHVPLILLAYYGGVFPTVISAIAIEIYRFSFGFTMASYLSVVLVSMVIVGAFFIFRLKIRGRQKSFLVFTFNNIVFSIILSVILKDARLLVEVLFYYWITSYLGGFLSFYLLAYLRKTRELFTKYMEQSKKDFLTGLNNYRVFDDMFNDLIIRLENNNEELSLLYLDIDFFKKVNDNYGHNEGDEVLKQFGHILQSYTRSFDIVSRNGGEEFTVLLPDCPVKKAMQIAERLREGTEQHDFLLTTGKTIRMTTSIGLANYPETSVNPIKLKDDADYALYQAKHSGRNKVCLYNRGTEI